LRWRERTQVGRKVKGRGRSRLPAEQGTQWVWGSIPGPWDHDLS